MIIDKQIITMPKADKAAGCVLVLPGRGIPAKMMDEFMYHTKLWRSLQVVLEPRNFQWYPQPNGPEDQDAAIWGQGKALEVIEKEIERIEKNWGYTKEQMAIVGFSAGAVMAIQLLAHSSKPYAGVIALAGAILEPKKLPKAKHATTILLQHNMDDDCFEWEERYIPMKEALDEQGYNVKTQIGIEGGHTLTRDEVDLTREFVAKQFGYWDDYAMMEEEEEEQDQNQEPDEEEDI